MTALATYRGTLLAIAAASGAFLTAYAAPGLVGAGLLHRTPLNAAAFLAVSVILLLGSGHKPAAPPRLVAGNPAWKWAPLAILVAVAAAFLPSLALPFVSDGCTHPFWASRQPPDAGAVLTSLLTHPQEGRFYRPVSFFSYYLNSGWAGLIPASWRTLNILLHLLDTALVWVLLRRLGASPPTAALASLLFGIHGSRPESVVWVGAHFEVLATLFTLLSSVWFVEWSTRDTPWRLAASLAACLLALLSKESSFVIPPLAALLALCLWRSGSSAVRAQALARACLAQFLLAGAVFAYRWSLLGGIGGYVQAGHPTILNFSPLHTAKALFLRIWAVMTMPINWSWPGEWWLGLAVASGTAALCWTAWRGTARPAILAAMAGAAILCVLPSQHLALIGRGLDGSRILHLATVPALWISALAVESASKTARAWWLAAAALVLLHAAALAHNLRIWSAVGRLAAETSRQAVQHSAGHPGPVVFHDVPNVIDGVYFLENGLSSCMAIAGEQRPERIHLAAPGLPAPPGALIIRWDARSRRLLTPND